MADELQSGLARLVSRTVRAFILEAREEDLDDLIRDTGEDPEALAEKGRAIIDMALAEHWPQKEAEAKEIYRRHRRNQWQRDL